MPRILLAEDDDSLRNFLARALERAGAADLRVFLLDHPTETLLMSPRVGDIVVQGKADLHPGPDAVSGRTGQGLDRLVARISAVLVGKAASAGVMTRERHRIAMIRAVETMESARHRVQGPGGAAELVALDHALEAAADGVADGAGSGAFTDCGAAASDSGRASSRPAKRSLFIGSRGFQRCADRFRAGRLGL